MQAVKGKILSIYKGGNFYRDYIHVEDVVSALRFLEQRVQNDIYLVGYGKPMLFKNIINHILALTGEQSETCVVEPPPFHAVVGIRNFVADTSKINALGWRASISPQEGIRRDVERYLLPKQSSIKQDGLL